MYATKIDLFNSYLLQKYTDSYPSTVLTKTSLSKRI
jgi:hypothetical protein